MRFGIDSPPRIKKCYLIFNYAGQTHSLTYLSAAIMHELLVKSQPAASSNTSKNVDDIVKNSKSLYFFFAE